MNHLVRMDDVTVVMDGKTILKHIALNLSAGQVITVIGPNGGGKTTLIKALLKLVEPSHGHVIHKKGIRISYVPQFLQKKYPFPLTVRRFLSLGSGGVLENGHEWLNIDSLMDCYLQDLSGGELQKTMLVYALSQHPDLLVLDEPLQGMDWIGQNQLYQALEQYRKKHPCAMVMVSHDLHFVMRSTAYVLCINQHICCQGKPSDIEEHPEFLAIFDYKPNVAVYTHHHDHEHH